MKLSTELISQFAKVTKAEKKESAESTVYGTVVQSNGQTFVKIDGSDRLTPVESTTKNKDGERVTVLIKNHSAVITGNTSSPSARSDDVDELNTKVEKVHTLIADKVSTKELDAEKARIDDLVAENATIKGKVEASEVKVADLEAANATITGKIEANEASIKDLAVKKIDADVVDAKFATIENLEAANASIRNLESDYGDFKKLSADQLSAASASIEDLKANKLSAADADLKYATIKNLDAASASIDFLSSDYGKFKMAVADELLAKQAAIDDLTANKLSTTDAAIKYANIDFSNIGKAAIEQLYATSGIIKDLVIGDTTVTGELVGVTICGDLIEGGTVVADKLVVKGQDGLYYKLNTDGATTEAQQTDYNSLSGQIIRAKSVTASKIAVDDLVAFGATIGGFHITDSALYSGAKSSATNTTRGVYLDSTGQLCVGDSKSYLRYYKGSDGQYRLEIAAAAMTLSTGQSVDEALEEVNQKVDQMRGEVSSILRIDSSRGTVFKNDQVSTVLTVTIFHGFQIITDINGLRAAYGDGAYLQWEWQRLDEDSFGIMSADDSRFSNDGFSFTLSPEDVDTKITFRCEIIVE